MSAVGLFGLGLNASNALLSRFSLQTLLSAVVKELSFSIAETHSHAFDSSRDRDVSLVNAQDLGYSFNIVRDRYVEILFEEEIVHTIDVYHLIPGYQFDITIKNQTFTTTFTNIHEIDLFLNLKK